MRAAAQRQVVCDGCALLCPAQAMATWTEQRPARRLRALGPPPDGAALLEDDPSRPYRSYTVEHRHQVCPACYAHLQAGGQFRAVTRHRGKLTFLVLVAALATLLALGPILLPHLLSAFWLAQGEGGR